MPNGVDFFGNPNQWATDYGHAQRQAEREAEQARQQARAWQAHAQEMEAAYKAMKAQRDTFFVQREAYRVAIQELDAKGALNLDVVAALYVQKRDQMLKQMETSKKAG